MVVRVRDADFDACHRGRWRKAGKASGHTGTIVDQPAQQFRACRDPLVGDHRQQANHHWPMADQIGENTAPHGRNKGIMNAAAARRARQGIGFGHAKKIETFEQGQATDLGKTAQQERIEISQRTTIDHRGNSGRNIGQRGIAPAAHDLHRRPHEVGEGHIVGQGPGRPHRRRIDFPP